ncbi:head-tail connector protein [Lacipirellula sp.]|uniref:head-tail connector protein n=1 Tax=Lacipirellula sp. TaxID=2691419 RepID=UPI003D10652D
MNYGLIQITPPGAEPLDLAEVMKHCNEWDDSNGPYIQNVMIPSARQRAEIETGRQLITATWKLTLPRFPCDVILLPKGRVQSVEEIKYVAPDGTETILDDELWRLLDDREPAEIEPVDYWPATHCRRRSAVSIKFRVGYGDAAEDVPHLLKAGMLMAIGHWYENRQEVLTGTIATLIPKSASDIFEQHRVGDDYVNYEKGG